MHSIVLEDNRNSRRYWIYTLIISTYCMNKSGFSYAVLLAVYSRILSYSYLHFSLFFSFIFLSSSPSLYPGSLHIFSFFFPCTHAQLEPLTFCIPLLYQSLFYTTTLRSSVDNFLTKNNFYFTSLVHISQNLQYNWIIHLLKAYSTLHENTHHMPLSLAP